MKLRWPAKLLVVSVLVYLGLASAGYDFTFLRREALRACKVTIEHVDVEPNLDMLSGIGEAVVTLDVWNPYPAGLTLAGGQFSLFLGAKEVGLARLEEGRPHRLQARAHNRFPVRVELDLSAALPELKSEISGPLSEMRLRDLGGLVRAMGQGRFGKALEKLQVKFRAEGEFTIETPLGAAVRVPIRALSKAAREAEAAGATAPAASGAPEVALEPPAAPAGAAEERRR